MQHRVPRRDRLRLAGVDEALASRDGAFDGRVQEAGHGDADLRGEQRGRGGVRLKLQNTLVYQCLSLSLAGLPTNCPTN